MMRLSEPRGNLKFLDGLRGLLCIIVVLSHCVQLYWPELRFTNSNSRLGSIEHFIASSPLNLIYSGVFPVSLFFVMSGFVISYKYNKTGEEFLIIKGFVKRYFRFFIPITASYIIMYILSMLFYPKRLSIFKVLFQTVFETYFRNIKTQNGVLWTISYEILGSFLIYALLSIFGKQKNKYLFYFIALIFTIDTQYSFFIFGLIMSNVYASSKFFDETMKSGISLILLFLSLFLVSYPIHYDMKGIYVSGIYPYITFTKNWDVVYEVYLKIGVFLFFFLLLKTQKIKNFFENGILLFLGKISFPLYLLHYIVGESILFRFGQTEYFYIFILKTILVFIITVLMAIPFEIYVDRPGIRLSNKIASFILAAPLFVRNKDR